MEGQKVKVEQEEETRRPVRGKADVVKITESDLEELDKEAQFEMQDDKFVKMLLGKRIAEKSEDVDDNLMAVKDEVDDQEESQEEILRNLSERPLEWFKNLKELPDSVAAIYYKDITRRWVESEARIKQAEDLLVGIKYEDRSLEEDRVDIMSELLDKATQSFEIYDEHQVHRIPIGHRIVLEVQLLIVFNNAIDRIFDIVRNFDKLKDDQVGVNDERDQLRYEIRYCDAVYTEVHERFLKSYLEMDW